MIYEQTLFAEAAAKFAAVLENIKKEFEAYKNKVSGKDTLNIRTAIAIREERIKHMEDFYNSSLETLKAVYQPQSDCNKIRAENRKLREENTALRTLSRYLNLNPSKFVRMATTEEKEKKRLISKGLAHDTWPNLY